VSRFEALPTVAVPVMDHPSFGPLRASGSADGHSSSDSSGQRRTCTWPLPFGTSTQAGANSSAASTTSGGLGSGVSMADACGWISSGQRGSQSQSALPHSLQKRRSAGERRARLPGSRISA